jgi:ferredoxin-NADP reductase
MAEARNARLTDAQIIGPETRLLTFQIEEARPLGFIGGQYVIVNTGLPLPGGKIAKRAYSILSADTDQFRFQIAVKRIGTGPGSNFMHTLSVGTEMTFSGPWGKFLPGDGEPEQPTLVFATDTGITAALGLLRSSRMSSSLAQSRLVWFVESFDYFLPESMVREAGSAVVKAASFDDSQFKAGSFENGTLVVVGPPVNHPERAEAAGELIHKICAHSKPERAYLSGDGAVLFSVCEQLKAMGVPEPAIRIECFFNNPIRKSP